MTSFVRCLHSELTDLYIVGVFFYAMNLLKHPLFQINVMLIGFFIFVEAMHVNYHRGLTQCEESVIIQELDATLGVTE